MCTRQPPIFRRSSSFNLSSQRRIYSIGREKNWKRKAHIMMLSFSWTDMRYFHLFDPIKLFFVLASIDFLHLNFTRISTKKKRRASLLTPFWNHTRIIPIFIYHFAFSQFDTSIQYWENIHRRWRERKWEKIIWKAYNAGYCVCVCACVCARRRIKQARQM